MRLLVDFGLVARGPEQEFKVTGRDIHDRFRNCVVWADQSIDGSNANGSLPHSHFVERDVTAKCTLINGTVLCLLFNLVFRKLTHRYAGIE